MGLQGMRESNQNYISKNEKFLLKVSGIVESNLENERFGVEQLAGEMNISRMQLYRKLIILTGKTVNRYIREERLKRAMEFLRKDTATVSEIAYRVGFSSPSYFSRCFNDFYGITPGTVSKSITGQDKLVDYNAVEAVSTGIDYVPIEKKGRALTIKHSFRIGLFAAVLVLGGISIKLFLFNPEKTSSSSNLDSSLAVLPFRNDSPEEDNQYFCNGMLEEISEKLRKIEHIRVISRSAVEAYRNTNKDPADIADELEVGNILEGSVEKYKDRFRLYVQLTQAKTRNQVWSETYEGSLSDTLFIVMSTIASEIAKNLHTIIFPDEIRQINKSYTSSYEAYDNFLRGRESLINYWTFGQKTYLVMAEKLFRKSVRIDPEFSSGYSGLCEIFNGSEKANLDSVKFYAQKVLEFDPYNGRGHAFMGIYYENKGDRVKAFRSYKKAIRCNPNDPWLYDCLGFFYCYSRNDFISGIRYLNKGKKMRIEQKIQTSGFYQHLAWLFNSIGENDLTKKYLLKSIETHLNCYDIFKSGYLIFEEDGLEEALNYYDSMTTLSPNCAGDLDLWKFNITFSAREFDLARKYIIPYMQKYGHRRNNNWFAELNTAYLLLREDKKEQALKIIDKTEKNLIASMERVDSGSSWWKDLGLAVVYCLKNDRENCLDFLSRSARQGFRMDWEHYIDTYAPLDKIRNDPEFKKIIGRVRDEKAEMRAQVREMIKRGEYNL